MKFRLSIFKPLFWALLVIIIWAGYDIWIHDYAIAPYHQFGFITSARDAYLYGFWSFAVLNVFVIAIVLKKWRWFISVMILMVNGVEDFFYYILLPFLSPVRSQSLGTFIPEKLNWLNDNIWLKFLSGADVVNRQGLIIGVISGMIMVIIFLLFSDLWRARHLQNLK